MGTSTSSLDDSLDLSVDLDWPLDEDLLDDLDPLLDEDWLLSHDLDDLFLLDGRLLAADTVVSVDWGRSGVTLEPAW
jgi:hypothetical protein